MFCRGIGESPLPTSPRWSTRTRVYLPLDPFKDQVPCTGWFFDTPSRWITHNCSQLELGHPQALSNDHQTPNHPKPSRWWRSPRVTSTNSHLTTTSLIRRVDAHFATLDLTNEGSLWDSQISITSLGPCSSWHSLRCFSAVGMSKSTPITCSIGTQQLIMPWATEGLGSALCPKSCLTSWTSHT